MHTAEQRQKHPAFPHVTTVNIAAPGLSVREYFAAVALQGILASGSLSPVAATRAVEMADALLLALNPPKSA